MVVDFILRSMPKDEKGNISKDQFRKWFLEASNRRDGDHQSKKARNSQRAAVRVADAVAKNERTFFANLLLEDFLMNKSYKLGEVERADQSLDLLLEMAPTLQPQQLQQVFSRSRSTQVLATKRLPQSNGLLLNGVNLTWNKRRFIPVDAKGHPILRLIYVHYFGLAALLGPVTLVKVKTNIGMLTSGKLPRNGKETEVESAEGDQVVLHYRKSTVLCETALPGGSGLPRNAKYKLHSKSQFGKKTLLDDLDEKASETIHRNSEEPINKPFLAEEVKKSNILSLYGRVKSGFVTALNGLCIINKFYLFQY